MKYKSRMAVIPSSISRKEVFLLLILHCILHNKFVNYNHFVIIENVDITAFS